jgi:multidrug efflux pump subunit AcrA (membrane-fusion protein)
VQRGDHVITGDPLAILTDHCELYIEGMAFEQDAHALTKAAQQSLPVSAWIESNGDGMQELSDLRVLYIQNEVERDSRALKFYVSLANQLSRHDMSQDGHRFIAWRYRPGQRVEVTVPVETWSQRIVLPVDAVVKEGAEWFVFQQNGGHFDRKSVHVEYRDQRWAVIENDGTLFPGDVVAATGAYQMHLAMKNKAGGGVDPHAGHSH